ncbi:MAG: phage terminase small subunit P27 family [Caulobacter sp.]|nr:phage terminase small subunit P27 family [Caulobacter sp.]
MRGRKPQPAAVQKAKAPVRSKRAAPKVEQAVAVGSVTPTRKLSPTAAKVWNALAPRLISTKLLGDLDAAAFTRYCQLTARFDAAERAIDDDGVVYWTASAHGKLKRANPAALLSLRYSRELAHLEANFGLTPADRQRIFADRARGGGPGDLFPEAPKKDEAKADAMPATTPRNDGPIGLLN